MSRSAASASAIVRAITTPLPAASPSYFSTAGQRTPLPRRPTPRRTSVNARNPAVGTAVFGHQLLGELLRGLDACRGLRRAEDPQSGRLEAIDDSRRQRHLGSHDRKSDALLRGEIAQALHLGLADRHALGLPRRCPRCREHSRSFRPAASASAHRQWRVRGRRSLLPKLSYGEN